MYDIGGLRGISVVSRTRCTAKSHSNTSLIAPGKNKIKTVSYILPSLFEMTWTSLDRRSNTVECATLKPERQDGFFLETKAADIDIDIDTVRTA